MAMYQFEDRKGQPVEISMPMSDAVSIGVEVKIGGKWLRRVVYDMSEPVVDTVCFASQSEPLWAPGAKAYDNVGRPCFENTRQAQEFAKLHGGHYGDKR